MNFHYYCYYEDFLLCFLSKKYGLGQSRTHKILKILISFLVPLFLLYISRLFPLK